MMREERRRGHEANWPFLLYFISASACANMRVHVCLFVCLQLSIAIVPGGESEEGHLRAGIYSLQRRGGY